MMKRFLAAALVWCALALPAHAISIISGSDTGGALGHTNVSGSTTVVVTTTATVSSGNLIVIMCVGGNLTWTAASDSAGNTYSAVAATSYASPIAARQFYTIATNTLSSGGTITCTANSASGNKTAVAAAFSGLAASPLDSASVSQTGSSGTYTEGPTGTLTYPGGVNVEVLLGMIEANTGGTPTNDASFTSLGTFNNGGGTQAPGAFGYKIVSANTPITYAPTGTSATYVGQLGAYKGTGTVTSVFHGLSATGAGQ